MFAFSPNLTERRDQLAGKGRGTVSVGGELAEAAVWRHVLSIIGGCELSAGFATRGLPAQPPAHGDELAAFKDFAEDARRELATLSSEMATSGAHPTRTVTRLPWPLAAKLRYDVSSLVSQITKLRPFCR